MTTMRPVHVDVSSIDLEIPEEIIRSSDENAVKEWIWQHRKKELLRNLQIEIRNKPFHEQQPQPTSNKLEETEKRLSLLDRIAQVQRQFLQSEGPKVVFSCLLEGLLQLMDSEYGFIGEVKYEDDGTTMYLQTHAITNIAWDAATRAFYDENVDSGLKFTNMKSLFGTVMVNKEPVISNTPKKDSRACGVPKGHPPLNHFLGIPFFKKGGEMNGMVGVANKPGGYSEQDIEFLEPFTVTCSNLIQAYSQIQQNLHLINTLEEKVTERTQELEQANRHLEDANKKVLRASAAQLQHFACMSHEIRTPLNCIIGLSSLLQETKLQPQQEETLNMIVSSGDLLLTVVNDVLDYSKLESGNVDIEVRKSNLQETLDSIVHSIEMKAKEKHLIVRTFYDTSLPEHVHTDSRRLQQILYNLLGNAIKFSKEGGVVELGVCICDRNAATRTHASAESVPQSEPNGDSDKRLEDGNDHDDNHVDRGSSNVTTGSPRGGSLLADEHDSESRCPFLRTSENQASGASSDTTISEVAPPSLHQGVACPFAFPGRDSSCKEEIESANVLRFVVKDYGRGINKKDFTRIFKPFDQATVDTERLYGGTGLGLAITSKLIHGLGGSISVDSVEDEWSRFTVELPLVDAPVDVEGLSKRWRDRTIILVHTDLGKASRFNSICSAYDIETVHFQSLDEMSDWTQKAGSIQPERSYICLVYEELFRPGPYEDLASMANSVLLTCGPKYSVAVSREHYRSLLRVIPSVLMKSMGIWLDSSAPVSKTTASIASSSRLRSLPVPYGDLRVLVAEDNLINQKVLHRMLKRLGMSKVDLVDNGQKAVDQEAVEEYDVVFMDMQMPVMGGVDACREIVKRRGSRSIPTVVFVTAHVESSFELEAANAGGSGFLPKPFNIQEIEKCFQKLQLSGSPPEDSSSLKVAASSEAYLGQQSNAK